MTSSPSGSARRMPSSVEYAQALLYVQASIWALMSGVAILLALTAKSATAGGSALVHDPALALGAAGVAAALAAAKAWLGSRIARRSVTTRHTVIAVEWLMAGFGGVLCVLTANAEGGLLPFCAGLGGGFLSLVAAIRLTKPPAKQYFARLSSEVTLASPACRPGDESSQEDMTALAGAKVQAKWGCLLLS